MSREDSTSATTTPAAPDPLFLSLAERVSRVEADVGWLKEGVRGLDGRIARLEADVSWLKGSVRKLDARLWAVLGLTVSMLLALLVNLLARLLP